MGKIWGKFHPLFKSNLKVGFETTFPKEAVVLNLDPLYEKSGLIYNSAKESVKRVYEPAVQILGSCLNGEAAQVFFEPVSLTGSLFRRLVFARKMKYSSRKPRLWMVAARYGEVSCFGFDSWNSRSERYLSLAYAGMEESFIPVYVKIQNGKEDFIYLEVWAWDEGEGKNVVVQARRISKNETPELLRTAQPGELVYSI